MTDNGMARAGQGSAGEAEAAREAEQAAAKVEAEAKAAAEAQAAAFADVIGQYHDDMARVAFVASGDVEIAAEAATSAWTEAWKGRATPRTAERLRAWLMGLAAREATWLTDAGSRARENAARGDAGSIATQAASAAAYRSEELDLANAFAALDSHDRQIVALRYVIGLGADDIGRELNMPGGAVQARVARVLKQLVEAVRGLATEGDSVEAIERGLAGRIRAFANRAVAPLDPLEIAKSAIAQAASEVSAADRIALRLGELLERLRELSRAQQAAAGGVVVAVVLGFFFLGGRGSGALAPTPFPTDATRECQQQELDVRVAEWAVDGDSRVATVQMRNTSAGACLVDNMPEPWLVQSPQLPMLVGGDAPGMLIRIGPGDTLRTTVRVRNYCGPAPKAPVTIAFRRSTTVTLAQPLNGADLSGVPPCAGHDPSPADVQMQPWGF